MDLKYPRTKHLPFSPGVSRDDLVLASTEHFNGKQVVISEKKDGENQTLTRDGLYARSISGSYHPWQSWIKAQHAGIKLDIPEDWRICGEYMYAIHSIEYTDLMSYFYIFSVWDENNFCLDWDETKIWAGLLNFPTVPVIYEGAWNEELVRNLYQDQKQPCEGFVVRIRTGFALKDFDLSVAKYVRAGHVTTDDHWRQNWHPHKLMGLDIAPS